MNTVICPLFGGKCPGPESCAPARFSVYVDEAGEEHHRCPIAVVTDSMQALAFSMEPFVRGLIGSPNTASPTVEDVGRERFLAEVIKPEHRDS